MSHFVIAIIRKRITTLKVNCFLPRLSLTEDDNPEREEDPEIDDYESDSGDESPYTLVKTNRGHTILQQIKHSGIL